MGGSWSGSSSTTTPLETAAATYVRPKDRKDVVLIPVDQSRQSEAAFDWYMQHVHQKDNVVRVVHCQEIKLDTPFLPELKGESCLIEEQITDARTTGMKLIEKFENKLSSYQVKGSVHSEFSPHPGEYICNALERYDGTMVVMGTRGFSPLRRTILGSVSQYVLNNSNVPVTVIPPDVLQKVMRQKIRG